MKTPNGTTITATVDGETADITEAVAAIYDLVIQSLNWGSGFLTMEDALPMAVLGRVCGFQESAEAERYLRSAIEGLEEDIGKADEHGAWPSERRSIGDRSRQRALVESVLSGLGRDRSHSVSRNEWEMCERAAEREQEREVG